MIGYFFIFHPRDRGEPL